MNEPIHANCLAEVIGGTLGDKSPNLGLIVRVIKYVGDDPVYGRIWRCEAEFVQPWATVEGAVVSDKARENLAKVPPGQLDFAQDWLRKIPDPKPPGETITKTVDDAITV